MSQGNAWIWAAGGVAALVVAGVGVRKYMSKTAIEIIKEHEGLRLVRYTDAAGWPTIGYGHKIEPGETIGKTITQAQAEALLIKDMQRIEREISPAIRVTLTENEKAALISFAFNVGANAFKSSTLLKKLNAGDKAGAAAELLRWNKARDPKTQQMVALPGLTRRRADEKNLFMTA